MKERASEQEPFAVNDLHSKGLLTGLLIPTPPTYLPAYLPSSHKGRRWVHKLSFTQANYMERLINSVNYKH